MKPMPFPLAPDPRHTLFRICFGPVVDGWHAVEANPVEWT